MVVVTPSAQTHPRFVPSIDPEMIAAITDPAVRANAYTQVRLEREIWAAANPTPETESGDPAPRTAPKDRELSSRFQAALAAVSVVTPSPGLFVTWEQVDRLRADDPEGFAAWSMAPRQLHLRSR